MSEYPPTRRTKSIDNTFSLTPLPLYRDLPRPLKSLEVADDSMAPTFSTVTGPMTKETFIQALNGEMNHLGIEDTSGGITSELLQICSKDGAYVPPTSDILTGIKIGWFSKPVPPQNSELFEHAQMDFQRDILRIMRDTEERIKRLVNTNQNLAHQSNNALKLVPGEEQLRNIESKDYQMMLWVVGYIFDLGDVKDIVRSESWNTAIKYLITKGWLEWGKRVHASHSLERPAITDLATRTRRNILKAPPFNDGSIILPSAYPIRYKDMASFSEAVGDTIKTLKKTYGKKKEKVTA
ncbi:phosphoprotein [Strawberry virus 3]|nr:phosphoprotein [Strawberry virus 3]